MTSRIEAPDTEADRQLREILDCDQLTGFTVVAGAGSGKTTSLVKALAHVTRTRGESLLASSQRVACITYTETAAREIHEEIGNDPLAVVSTIHAFLWQVVRPFQKDVGAWVSAYIDEKIEELVAKQQSYTPRTQATTKEKDAAKLEKRRRQREAVTGRRVWNYGVGANYGRGVVGHADILKMVPQMVLERRLLARLVARRFPIVFVDESQDTFPEVVECLKHAWSLSDGKMCLGFFGDPMQQIYLQGVGSISPEAGWHSVGKPENFRCSRRVLACVNAVRAEGDSMRQISGLGASQTEGEAFCFVLPLNDRRSEYLELARAWLDRHSDAGNWTTTDREAGSKVLVIEHRMAASRLGFEALFSAFHGRDVGSLKESFDEGNPWPLTPFRDVILPLSSASDAGSPEVLGLLKKCCPLLQPGRTPLEIQEALSSTREAVDELQGLARLEQGATLGELLRCAADRKLLELDPRLAAYLDPDGEGRDVVLDERTLKVLDGMTSCYASELEGYYTYVNQQSPYSTQHGTKGSEFERVVVVLDDDEGRRSTLYSYDKLFGLKDLSDKDRENRGLGKDSAIERTRRLLYVCVSRAKESLAIVLFARDVSRAVAAIERSVIGELVDILTMPDLENRERRRDPTQLLLPGFDRSQ